MTRLETQIDSSPAATGMVQFHLSLHVVNLAQSCTFYTKLLATAPVSRYEDYAKFELVSPPLVLTLSPNEVSGAGVLNHLGLRLPGMKEVVDLQLRLEAAGITTQREEGVACCHSRQTKFWVADPDGNPWEIYTLIGDENEGHCGDVPRAVLPVLNVVPALAQLAQPAKSIWAHRLGEPVPARIMALDASVDQVQLHGLFNAACDENELRNVFVEIDRVLKPAGELFVHGLVADGPRIDLHPNLPGPASVVEIVPTLADILQLLREAGFQSLEITKLSSHAVFVSNGIALREVKLTALKEAI